MAIPGAAALRIWGWVHAYGCRPGARSFVQQPAAVVTARRSDEPRLCARTCAMHARFAMPHASFMFRWGLRPGRCISAAAHPLSRLSSSYHSRHLPRPNRTSWFAFKRHRFEWKWHWASRVHTRCRTGYTHSFGQRGTAQLARRSCDVWAALTFAQQLIFVRGRWVGVGTLAGHVCMAGASGGRVEGILPCLLAPLCCIRAHGSLLHCLGTRHHSTRISEPYLAIPIGA